VLGCGLSARAACELRDQAGIDATTIARLMRGVASGVELTPGAVLIVDEAGMVGTRDLAALAEAARDSNAKLVLVGDDCQLPEIRAGGAFRALAQRLGPVELHEVRRESDGWDREALASLRSGDWTASPAFITSAAGSSRPPVPTRRARRSSTTGARRT
jgi:ATP-dependent exoDNAse (exonuclease V) alpha subunit